MKQYYPPEEVINSLDKLHKATPSPYLHTRIQAKMDRVSQSPEIQFFRFVSRPVFALALALIFLLMHSYLLVYRINNKPSFDEASNLLAVEYVQPAVNPYEPNDIP